MAEKRVAVVLGSSGAVGQRLLSELVGNPAFGTVLTVVRTPSKSLGKDNKVVEHVVSDMKDLDKEVEKAVSSIGGASSSSSSSVVGFSTLGVGHGTIFLSIDQHRAVDVELNRQFAQGLKNTGRVKHMVFMSAAGADPEAYAGGPGSAGMPRYNRVKGEAEEAVKAIGFDSLSIFRPAAILGIPNTGKLVEWIVPLFGFMTPAKMQSVRVEDLAKSMALRGAQDLPGDKVKVFHHPEMMELINHTSG